MATQFQVSGVAKDFISSPEEVINEARNGRMFILIDDEGRENEGDLVIPAQMATPHAINFMATYGRGLICLALCKERVDNLRLTPMSRSNGTKYDTAFTISIEARDGVTTGISAKDRARTIAVAVDSAKGPEDIVSPGHVFPLAAHPGGVLVRAGHTEAAVDVARLAGLNPSGVICEIMKDDGTMARLDDLVPFAQRHRLKIGTIRDLVAYRLRADHLVEKVAEGQFLSDYGGAWRLYTYRDKVVGAEHLVLHKGNVPYDRPTLARVHERSLFFDLLGKPGPRKRLLQRTMAEIGRIGAGVIVLLGSSGIDALPSITPGDADRNMDLRSYGIGAQILLDVGLRDIILVTNARRNIRALEGFGLNIVGQHTVPDVLRSNVTDLD